MSVTQKQVADRAGVTRSVVSRVLYGGSSTIRVSESTAKRVKEVAEEMGYHPNTYARNFRKRRTGMIGLLHGDGFPRLRFAGGVGYFGTLMDGIVDGAFAHDYTVGICPDLFGANPVGSSSQGAIADGRFDGFIWYCTYVSPESEERMKRCNAPVVVLHSPPQTFGNRFPSVICDNEAGIRLALDHLSDLGHRRIGFVGEVKSVQTESSLRRDLVLKLGSQMGFEVAMIDIKESPTALDGYFQTMPKETALIAHSDEFAVAAMRSATRNGLRIPEDVSIIGFDSTAACDAQYPPLTAISQPLQALGATAVEILVKRINGETEQPLETVLPCGFDVRGSTGPPRS